MSYRSSKCLCPEFAHTTQNLLQLTDGFLDKGASGYVKGVLKLFDFLNQGLWTKPSDKMAVYTEILPNQRWGIRVTLFADTAKVEAIDGPQCSWYQVSSEIATIVRHPSFLEKLRGVTFEDKLRREVEAKRSYAYAQNTMSK